MPTPSMEDYLERIYKLIDEKDMRAFRILPKAWRFTLIRHENDSKAGQGRIFDL